MTPSELFRGILQGDCHVGGLRSMRLLRVGESLFPRLISEVTALCNSESPSDVTRPEHVTNWTKPFGSVRQYSLLNRSGLLDDFSSDHDLSCLGKRFFHDGAYPALGEFISWFPCAVNFRIAVIGRESGLSAHEEHAVFLTKSGTVGARIRFHLPVVTNPEAEMLLDGHVYHLDAATVWFVNHGCVHSAINRGNEDRIHLNWDMLLTQDTFKLMFGDACTPAGLSRVEGLARCPAHVRTDRIKRYERIPPLLPRQKAESLGFCEVQ